MCIYVDSSLRFQFYLIGLLGKGMVVDFLCVCRHFSVQEVT